MKKIISVLLSFVLIVSLLAGISGSALAAQKVTKVVTGKIGASLRSSPEVLGYNKICGIHADVYLDVYDEYYGWYYVQYNGQYGWVNAGPKIVTVVATEEISPYISIPLPYTPAVPELPSSSANRKSSSKYAPNTKHYPYLDSYDIGIPKIGRTVFSLNQMNLVILWVQTQLKATGKWYRGSQWDVSGSLDEHTMSEIRSFMAANGYPEHTGVVDQKVVNTLSKYLGKKVVPVRDGGIYQYMNSITSGDSYGTMPFIISNLRDNLPHETVGARWVQTVLSGLGYYTGPIDGKYGILTQDAVILFQRNNGFQQCDYVTLGVARAMLEQYYSLNKNMLALP